MQTAVILTILAALCMQSSLHTPGALAQQLQQRHAKSGVLLQVPRTVRGFKNMGLSTARGFGKRAGEQVQGWSQTLTPQDEPSLEQQGLPVAWVAEQLQSNPALARLLLRRFVDTDRDDRLSPEELLLRPAE